MSSDNSDCGARRGLLILERLGGLLRVCGGRHRAKAGGRALIRGKVGCLARNGLRVDGSRRLIVKGSVGLRLLGRHRRCAVSAAVGGVLLHLCREELQAPNDSQEQRLDYAYARLDPVVVRNRPLAGALELVRGGKRGDTLPERRHLC